jgi:outer membrane protein
MIEAAPRRFPGLGIVATAASVVALFAAPRVATAQALGPEVVLERALAANPGLRAALLDAVAAREAHRAAVNSRRPAFVASLDARQAESLSGTASGVVRNLNREGVASVGLRYTTDWGTVVTLDVTSALQVREVNRDPSTTQLFRIGPNYSGEARITARQPLLRGAGADVILAEVEQTAATEEAARQDRVRVTSQLVQDLLVAYWELWYADRALAVQRESLGVTERQREETRLRAETLGTAARTDVLVFATEAGSIRESLATADAARRSRAIELGRFLAVGPDASLAFVPEAEMPDVPAAPTTDRLLAVARASSPELAAISAELDATRVQVRAARDASRARLDLFGTAGLVGLWNDDWTPSASVLTDPLPGLALPGGRPAVYVTLGLELELPMGPSRGRAEYAQSRAQLGAAEARYEASLLAIDARIASLREELDAARQRASLARETAELASELAEAERHRLRLGTTTSFDVLRAQQQERETELRGLRALVDAVTTSLRLDHAAGRLLERFSLSVPEGST